MRSAGQERRALAQAAAYSAAEALGVRYFCREGDETRQGGNSPEELVGRARTALHGREAGQRTKTGSAGEPRDSLRSRATEIDAGKYLYAAKRADAAYLKASSICLSNSRLAVNDGLIASPLRKLQHWFHNVHKWAQLPPAHRLSPRWQPRFTVRSYSCARRAAGPRQPAHTQKSPEIFRASRSRCVSTRGSS